MSKRRGTPQARLVSQLHVTGPDECWLWIGEVTPYGYAQMREGQAHRVAYTVFIGPIPEGLDVDHECHNKAARRGECAGGRTCLHRRCCNPWHLRARSRAENLNGGLAAWSTTATCKHGHPAEGNRKRTPNGQSYCRSCRNDYRRRRRENIRPIKR